MKQYKFTENNLTYDVIECLNGAKHWYKNGVLHRDDGPSIEWDNGYKSWWKNGERHRDDGPAIEYANGEKDYWYNGEYLGHINSDKELKRYIKLLSIS